MERPETTAQRVDAAAPADAAVAGQQGKAFDVAAYLRRARRLADLSQRDLAQQLGVSRSAVGRWEGGDRSMTVAALDGVLRLAGLRLAVLDEDGREVRPFDADSVRDNSGRHFPAHLDVVPPDQRPGNRGAGLRWDRPPARGWYAKRPERDAEAADGRQRPRDHPTAAELRDRRRPRPAVTGWTLPPCTCLDDCPEHPACPPTCPCQCEPEGPPFRAIE
jgi:HTH-type transcriptional regulator/antitoxin HipB